MEYRAKNRVLTEWLNSYQASIISCKDIMTSLSQALNRMKYESCL